MSNELNNLSYANEGSLYVPKPIGELLKTAQALKGQYDAGVVAADAATAILDSANARDLNKAALKGKYDEYKVGLDEVAKRGNFEDFVPQAKKIARGFANDPTVKGIVKDYQDAQAWTAEQKARIGAKENGISESDFRRALILNQTQNNKPLEYDPVTGVYKNSFNGNTIPQNIDFTAKIQEMVKALDENSTEGFGAKAHGYLQSIKKTTKDPQRIRELVGSYLMQSDEAQSLMAFRAKADVVSNLMQSDGSLRPLTVKDLAKAGIVPASGIPLKPVYDEKENPIKKDGKYVMEEDTELKKILYNPDGTVNQKNALARTMSAKMSDQRDALLGHATSYSSSKTDVTYLEDFDASQRRKKEIADYESSLRMKEKDQEVEYNDYLGMQTALDALQQAYVNNGKQGKRSIYVQPSATAALLGDQIDVNAMISGTLDGSSKYSKEIKSLIGGLKIPNKTKDDVAPSTFINLMQTALGIENGFGTEVKNWFKDAANMVFWGVSNDMNSIGLRPEEQKRLEGLKTKMTAAGYEIKSDSDVMKFIKYAKDNEKQVSSALKAADAIQRFGHKTTKDFQLMEGTNESKDNLHVVENKYYADVSAGVGQLQDMNDEDIEAMVESGFLVPETTGEKDTKVTNYRLNGKYRVNFNQAGNANFNAKTNNKTTNYKTKLQNENYSSLQYIYSPQGKQEIEKLNYAIEDYITDPKVAEEAKYLVGILRDYQDGEVDMKARNLMNPTTLEVTQRIKEYNKLKYMVLNALPDTESANKFRQQFQ